MGSRPDPRPPVALARVRLPPARLPESARAELRALLGGKPCATSHAERVRHAAGKGYPDLVRLRAGEPEEAPDAVLYPSRPEQLGALLRAVRGALDRGGAVRRRHERRGRRGAAAAGSTRRWLRSTCASSRTLVELDGESRLVTVQAGMRAPALERHLAAQGSHARALPAVLRVRLAGRLRGERLGRAGVHRLRALRGAGARPAPDRARR